MSLGSNFPVQGKRDVYTLAKVLIFLLSAVNGSRGAGLLQAQSFFLGLGLAKSDAVLGGLGRICRLGLRFSHPVEIYQVGHGLSLSKKWGQTADVFAHPGPLIDPHAVGQPGAIMVSGRTTASNSSSVT